MLQRLLGVNLAIAGALYFGLLAWMEWTGWRLDMLTGRPPGLRASGA